MTFETTPDKLLILFCGTVTFNFFFYRYNVVAGCWHRVVGSFFMGRVYAIIVQTVIVKLRQLSSKQRADDVRRWGKSYNFNVSLIQTFQNNKMILPCNSYMQRGHKLSRLVWANASRISPVRAVQRSAAKCFIRLNLVQLSRWITHFDQMWRWSQNIELDMTETRAAEVSVSVNEPIGTNVAKPTSPTGGAWRTIERDHINKRPCHCILLAVVQVWCVSTFTYFYIPPCARLWRYP